MKTLTRKPFAYLILSLGLLAACGTPQKEEATDSAESAESQETETAAEITLTKLTGSPAYADATLSLSEPSGTELDTGATTFTFNVSNYELGTQTEGAGVNGLANSGNGQHIHFIVDNGPYSAHYEPTFDMDFEEGSHVVLAFLSRSFHESVKNPNAFVVKQFNAGDAEPIDFTAPHMFYSRPKGTYADADAEKVMLDFYLLNTTLSPGGNHVRATINGQEFIIEEWAPFVIEGLPSGQAVVKLELLDGDGNPIPGPFNTVERTVDISY